MIPVRLNTNQLSITCEKIVGQKKELHITSFEYALEKVCQQMMEKQEEYARRFAADFSSSIQILRTTRSSALWMALRRSAAQCSIGTARSRRRPCSMTFSIGF